MERSIYLDQLYFDGFLKFKIDPKNSDLKNINEIIKSIEDGNIKEGFSMETKYDRSADLRPSTIEYDASFSKVCESIGVIDILNESFINEVNRWKGWDETFEHAPMENSQWISLMNSYISLDFPTPASACTPTKEILDILKFNHWYPSKILRLHSHDEFSLQSNFLSIPL